MFAYNSSHLLQSLEKSKYMHTLPYPVLPYLGTVSHFGPLRWSSARVHLSHQPKSISYKSE